MTSISPRGFCEAIYCAVAPLDAFDVEPTTRRIAFDARVTYQGKTKVHRVAFEGVHELTRKDPTDSGPRDPGDRIELSVVEVEREPGGWRVWFNPWYLEQIEFRCDRIQLDDAEVDGSGRWLQDDLPSRPAG